MNLWHDLEAGSPDELNVVVEISKGSKNKYEVDKETGLLKLDRVLYSAQDFPVDYGFVPRTLALDGDPLDVVLFTTYPLLAGSLVVGRTVALLKMLDDGEEDDKIIAVPAKDPRWEKVRDLTDLNSHSLKELEHFYATYKQLQGKEVTVGGFQPKTEAERAISQAIKLYQEKVAR